MQKLLFVIDSLRIGGVQTSLVHLLKTIDYQQFEVTLCLFNQSENDNELLPKEVKIANVSYVIGAINETRISAKRKGVFTYLCKFLGAGLCRTLGADRVYKLLFSFSKRNRETYDIAISYNNNGSITSTYWGCNMYVLDFVSATKKMAWLHVDYEAMNMNTRINNAQYERFDKIVAVSNACREVFLRFNSNLASKTTVVYNIIDQEEVIKKSKIETEYRFDPCCMNIVTVSRIDSNKNIDACVRIAERLSLETIPYRWTFVGDGQDSALISQKIRESRLDTSVIMVGYQSNPYPYIAQSDFLVSSSLSESFGLSIYEATILGVPVVALDYPALKEIVTDYQNGLICKTEEDLYSAIKKLCLDKSLYQHIKNQAKPQIDSMMTIRAISDVFTF